MDLVNWDAKRYHTIKNTLTDFLTKIGFKEASFLPMSAFLGENLNSTTNLWKEGGPCLLNLMETKFK